MPKYKYRVEGKMQKNFEKAAAKAIDIALFGDTIAIEVLDLKGNLLTYLNVRADKENA